MLWRRGKAYSQDLRERVLAAADEGRRVGQIATMLRVSVSYVSKVLSRRQQTGATTALPQRCHVPRKLAGLHDAIGARVRACPDATLVELRSWVEKYYRDRLRFEDLRDPSLIRELNEAYEALEPIIGLPGFYTRQMG